MALHCAATLLLVTEGGGEGGVDDTGPAATHGPWPAGTDVVAELQHLADQHRGERVLVTLAPEDLVAVLTHLGRTGSPGGVERLRLEVGDDGWSVLPWPPA